MLEIALLLDENYICKLKVFLLISTIIRDKERFNTSIILLGSLSSCSLSTSTASTISTPAFRGISVGKLLSIPPSTNTFSSCFTGIKSPGTDVVARIAKLKFPCSKMKAFPFFKSTETTRNGIGSCSI